MRRYCAAGQFEPEAPLESIEATGDTPIMEEYLERSQSPEQIPEPPLVAPWQMSVADSRTRATDLNAQYFSSLHATQAVCGSEG